MNLSVVIGIVLGVVLIGGAIFLGGNAIIFLSVQSIMIVLGGTLAGTMASFSLPDLKKIPSLLKIIFTRNAMETDSIIEILVNLAKKARREGLLTLEQEIQDIDDPFLEKGVQLVVDGTEPELVKDILETKLSYMETRHSVGKGIFDKMGQLSPAFGMIGTLIGLIQMLSELDDPSKLGAGMATALITTLYGAFLANLIFIPLANKLKMQSQEEVLVKELMIEGILSIQAGENPRIIEEKLKAFLSQEGSTQGETEQEEQVNTSEVVGENA
ncbi:MAG TPA: MotA/TolQ/ExbB proton channel family protein [Halanaerobiales bacterium]|nr:MotA/TolQ/ExbB proton channel family protein [Halanaerobiales bacterium]